MSKPNRGYQRRQVIVDREFQLGFVIRFGGFLLFYLLFFIMVVVVGPVALALLGGESEWAIMEMSFRVEILLRLILAPIVCTFLCLFIHGILETFRIAGPNYRLKSVFQQMTSLRIPRGVRVRKNDYLQDTAHGLSEALVTIHEQVQQVQEQSQLALTTLRNDDREDALKQLEKLNESVAQFTLLTAAPECAPFQPKPTVTRDKTPAEPVSPPEPVSTT